MIYWETIKNIKKNWHGAMNKLAAFKAKQLYKPYLEYFDKYMKPKFGIDIYKVHAEATLATDLEEQINYVLEGCKDVEEYRHKVSSCNNINGIEIPTMFYYSLDDPLIYTNSIDFKACKSNPNVILSYTEHGSHLSTFSSLFSKEQWMI